MKKIGSIAQTFLGAICLVSVFSLIIVVNPSGAWRITKSAESICVDNESAVNWKFGNAEPDDPRNGIRVTVFLPATGQEQGPFDVYPGESVDGTFMTGKISIGAGKVEFHQEWISREGDTHIVRDNYEARDCTPEVVCTVTNFVPYTKVNIVDDHTAAVQAWAEWDQGPEEIKISWDFGGRTDTYRRDTPPIPPDPGWELERKAEPYTVTVTFIVEENGEECYRQTVEVEIPAKPEPPVCTVADFTPFTVVNIVDDHTAAVQAWAEWDQGPEEIKISWDFGGRTDTYRRDTPPIPPDPGWELERKAEPYTVTVTFIVEENGEECYRQTVEVEIPAKPEPPPTGSVTVDKIDQDGQQWTGVTIELLKDGGVIATGTTPVTFSDLELGTYLVREIVPEGSEPMGPTQYEFTLDEEHLSFEFTFQNRGPANCIVTDIKGTLYYQDNHLSGNPVAGYVQNLSFDERCQDELYLEVFGSDLEPESDDWLESQTHTEEHTIPVPPGTIEHLGFTQLIDTSEYCWYQVDLTREKTQSPYISGDAMVEYVFVKGTKPGCDPTGSVTVDKIDEIEEPWTGVSIELLKDGEVIATGQTPVTFSDLELGTYVVREIVPEGSEPIGPTQFEFTLDEEHLSFEFTFQNRRPEPPPPTAVCKFTEATMTWKGDYLIIKGKIEGFGTDWRIKDKRSQEVASGSGDHGTFLIKKEWEDPNDHEDRYRGWIKGHDGQWRTSSECEFLPKLSCPECGFPVIEGFGDNASTPETEDGDQLVFWADHCSVGPCNSLVLTTEVLYRSIGDNFQLPYKGDIITGTPVSRVAGEVYEAKFDFTWLEDGGQDFILLDEDGKRIRDEESHGQNGVNKYISCSLTVGLVDIDCDAMAYYTEPQTVWDWQWAIIREWKLLDNKQSSWDQVAEWARVLMAEGELSLLDLDQYGTEKPIDLSALDNLLAPCDATDSNVSNTLLQLEQLTT